MVSRLGLSLPDLGGISRKNLLPIGFQPLVADSIESQFLKAQDIATLEPTAGEPFLKTPSMTSLFCESF